MSRRASTSPVIDHASGSSLTITTGGWRLVIGFGVVALVASVHAVHNLSHGYPRWLSVLSSAMIVGQCAALTLGRWLALRWNAPRWSVVIGGALVSAAFGLVILVPLSRGWWPWSSAVIAAGGVLAGLVVASLWLLVFQLPLVVDRARLHALEVESLRREAELSRVRVQLHPHFLLNTLNAIAGLVTEDAAEARRLIVALGDLVRDALSEGDELRPFAAEVAWLRRYAEILETRHRGLLSFHWELAQESLAARVPRLLLQPLVENAVKHGALRRREGGSVLVRSEALRGGTIRFVIEDDGPGLGPEPSDGLGISLVRRRLALMCPGSTIRFVPLDAGTRVVVEIPRPPEAGA
jgi:signal transduction histidine kinase